ncbi:MAG: hypothetical protein ACTHZI_03820 [Luteimonas sp.]
MKYRVSAAVLAAMLFSVAAIANDQVLVSTDAQAIISQQQEIREEAVARNGRYRDMEESARSSLLAEQDKVLELLEGKERSTDLSQIDQTILFNSLEKISAIVNQAEDERMVCRRERTTGSHRVQNICKTVAQLRDEREQSQSALGNRDIRCDNCGSDMTRPEGW